MYTISIFDSISEIDKQQWDMLLFDSVFASYGWLKTAEVTYRGDIRPKYIVVKEADNFKLIRDLADAVGG